MSVEQVETVVIGAGVVGLAIARALAQAGQEVLVLEAAAAIGTVTSSRNSEVIHAGIYYPPGSRMAALCVRGRALLYEYCADRGIAHRRCGKLIVATDAAEAERLPAIAARAAANGAHLTVMTRAEALALEPALACTAALHSPATGILDSHAFMLALQADAEAAGALFAFNAPVTGGSISDRLTVQAGDTTLACRRLINAAGLDAPAVATRLGLPPAHVPGAWFAKGCYFGLTGRAPFSRLIYPVPVPGGLGIHLTLDLAGQARFGPNVEWIDAPNYDIDPTLAAGFTQAIRRYWPGLPDHALTPDYAGVRPKIVPPGAPAQDFRIDGPETHGIAGLVNLFGIESPGLTSSLAIAEDVSKKAVLCRV
jgi:L-2-hydroxyglutarate oxidase LhgO